LIRIKPDQRVAQWLRDADDTALYLSAISIGEVCKGFTIHPEAHRRASLRNWLDDTLRPWFAGRILPVNEAITIVTRNVKDFEDLGVNILNPWEVA
jgi:toxin FitB